ncbi:MAG: DUF2461 domain-containing protein [Bacteroidia bacterium]|nr:DUF2461 domain-containing protein [Bacteroidia bacterium]
MLTKEYFTFLNELKFNNDKVWFAKNKPLYDKLKFDFEKIVAEFITAIATFDSEIGNLTPKDCVFRIYKDIRFSKDKTPYKTNFGAFFVAGGRKSGMAGYYIHIEPGECFIGGGIYMPPAPILKKLREEIYNNFEEFTKIINNKDFKANFKEISGSKTTLMPKGFDKNFKGAEYLKFKDFTVIHEIKDEFLLGKDAFKKTTEIFKAMKPFNDFLNKSFGM